jgi:hypothetical protein
MDNRDGVFIKTSRNEFDEILAFESNQIKLADGTNTTFDPNNDDIRFENGGLIDDMAEIKLRLNEEHQKIINDKNNLSFDILTKKGEKIGNIGLLFREDLDGYQVYNARVIKKGKGIGKKAYIQLREILGKPIISDSSRTEDAENLWKSIERNNLGFFDKKINKYKMFENGGLTEIEQWKLEQAQNDQQAFNLLQNYFGFELPENADTYEYKKGGNLDKDIECHKCGWEWDKKDSEKFDMYVCHKCGFDNSDFYKRGGRTVAQTPAPSSERIYGSKRNKPSSSKDSSSAESIKFDQKTLTSIENKVEKHNAEHRDKRISLSIAKAIVRRGMGAYSKSHRPTIKGGKPNSRVAWGLARLNAFIYKVVNGVSKSGKYSQDNDLLDELGIAHEKFKTGGKISKKNKHGDCYVVAGRIALNNRLPKGENREFVGEPYVTHAQVMGQGAIAGLKYGHAWVEDDVYVYDYSNGRELKIPKVVYYKLGQVIEQQPIYFKYTFGEAKRKMAETGHFGSWDLITESGL